MRKHLLALSLVAAGVLAAPAFAETKIAVADIQEAILATDSAKKTVEALNASAKPQQDRVDALRKEMQALQARYKKDEAVMSAKDKEGLQKQMQAKLNEHNTILQTQQRKTQETLQDIAQRFLPKAAPVVDELRKAGGYDLILDRKSAMYFDPALDLTKKITEKLNAAK